jgi:hypothetical protein
MSAGTGLPVFQARGRPSIFKIEDMNRLVAAINNFLKLKVNIASNVGLDGTISTPFGNLTLSEDGGALNLYIPLSGGGSGGTTVQPMTVVSQQDNWLTCTFGDGSPAGATTYVAKPHLLQRATYDGLTETLFDGLAHTFSYHGVNTRTNTVTLEGTSVGFEEVISSDYLVGQVIQAYQPVGGTGFTTGGNAIVWQDSNDGARDWATQFTSCIQISGTFYSGFQLVKGGAWYPNSLW